MVHRVTSLFNTGKHCKTIEIDLNIVIKNAPGKIESHTIVLFVNSFFLNDSHIKSPLKNSDAL